MTSLAAAGCWPQPGAGPGNQNHNGLESTLTASNVGTLTEIWTAGGVLDSVYGGHVLGGTDRMNTSLPPTGSAYVTSLDAGTGALNWRHDLQEYVGTRNAAQVTAPPVVVGDQVWTGWYQLYYDGYWRCKVGMAKLDLATGERTFTWPDGPRAFVPYGEQVAASFQPCSGTSAPLAVLDPAQPLSVLWQGTGASVSRPVLVGERLLTDGATTLQAYAAEGCGAGECAPQWTADLGITVEAVAAGQGDQALVLGRASGGPTELVAVDTTDGSIAWRAVAGGTVGRLAVAGSTVYVAAGDALQAYPTAGCGAPECLPTWEASLPTTVSASLAVAGGLVYVGTTDGAVGAYDAGGCGAASCAAVAQVDVAASPTDVVVSGGRLFVGQGRGLGADITAFAPAG
ncbi:MAG: PQQ-binding-like beta-propeller repeat protein [Acidimicrobiales bacterium]|nr:PQQ-binding-like beta-propeller repeat protein [Acidimicrobiales bacterium]